MSLESTARRPAAGRQEAHTPRRRSLAFTGADRDRLTFDVIANGSIERHVSVLVDRGVLEFPHPLTDAGESLGTAEADATVRARAFEEAARRGLHVRRRA
jgi:hypothetical protein